MATGVSTLVGNSIGENNIMKAKKFAKIGVAIAIILGLTMMIIVNSFRR